MQLSCNIDDMTGEEIGFALSAISAAGAKDVCAVPIMMKKNRPAVMLTVLCDCEDKDAIVRSIFANTTTIGIREAVMDRHVLERTIVPVETVYGTVRKKVCSGYGVTKEKPEYDDLLRISKENGITLQEAKEAFLNGKEKPL